MVSANFAYQARRHYREPPAKRAAKRLTRHVPSGVNRWLSATIRTGDPEIPPNVPEEIPQPDVPPEVPPDMPADVPQQDVPPEVPPEGPPQEVPPPSEKSCLSLYS